MTNISPYNKEMLPSPLNIEVFISKNGLKYRKKVVFTDEEFEALCELLKDMFPYNGDKEGIIDFVIEDNDFEIEEIKSK